MRKCVGSQENSNKDYAESVSGKIQAGWWSPVGEQQREAS